MRAIILARVSTSDQIEEGQSVPAQLARAREYAERKKLNVVKEFPFDESSLKDHRKKFEQVIDEIEASKERIALIAETIDRVQRSFKESVLLLELIKADKVEVHFIRENLVIHKNSNSSEFIRWDMGVMFARSYVLNISDNVKRTFELKRRKGELTHKPPIGYISVPLNEEKRLRKDVIVDPERGHLITALFELWSTGNYSTRAVLEKITSMGLRSRNGQKISKSQIPSILQDTTYYGMARSKYGAYEHHYPRLVSRELFDKCQAVFENRSKKPSKVVASRYYIFQGLLPCKHCGCLYSPETHKGNNYYSCTNSKGICKREYVNEKDLLKRIYSVFSDFERIPRDVQEKLVTELRTLNEGEADYHNKQIVRIQAEYNRLQGKVDALLDALLEKSITKDVYDKKLQELKDKQHLTEIELEEHTNADHEYHVHVATVFNLARHMKEIFESSEPVEKRAFLNYLLQNPVVDGKKLEFTLRKPYNYIQELATCPNWLRW